MKSLSDLTSMEEIPSGWSFNPSSWKYRLPLVGIAFLGFLIAGYLSLYQFRIIQNVWDPFFGSDSIKVLTSSMEKMLPIPDAAAGALGYLTEVALGLIGGTARWRTSPWKVFLFSFVAGLLSLTGIFLAMFQSVVLHSWCTLCLASALCSIVIIGPASEELLACFQYLKRVKDSGNPVWKFFWINKTDHLNMI